MGERHCRIIAAAALRSRRRPICRRRRGETAEIVEPDLRCRKGAELGSGLPVEIAQQAIAEPIVGQRAQLFLDGLERLTERRSSRHGLVEIELAGIEAHRKQGREPADRAREIDVREDILAAMTLQIQQHRMASAATPTPEPVGDGQHQGGQQHIVDAAIERRRHRRQQRRRSVGGKSEGQVPLLAGGVPTRVERAVDEWENGLAQHRCPERDLIGSLRLLRMSDEALSPAAERRAARRQGGNVTAADRLPGGGQVRHQDAP